MDREAENRTDPSMRETACARVLPSGSPDEGRAGYGRRSRQHFHATVAQGNKETVLTLQAHALEALKDLLRPEVTAQLRERLSQKMDTPKTVEDNLAEKKRELEKKRAYGVTLQDQHKQMVEKIEQQVARMHKHCELVFECQHQIAVVESGYEELRAEFQSGPPQMVVEEVVRLMSLSRRNNRCHWVVMSWLSLMKLPRARKMEMVSWMWMDWRWLPRRQLRRSMLTRFANCAG